MIEHPRCARWKIRRRCSLVLFLVDKPADFSRDPLYCVNVKIVCECASGVLKAALCGTACEPELEGALDASPALQHQLRVNLRARGAPALVEDIALRAAERLPGVGRITRFACFQPAAPKPERTARYLSGPCTR